MTIGTLLKVLLRQWLAFAALIISYLILSSLDFFGISAAIIFGIAFGIIMVHRIETDPDYRRCFENDNRQKRG